MSSNEVRALFESGVRDQLFPGAAYAFGTVESFQVGAVGRWTYDDGSQFVTPETLYDLASLTKPIATATALSILVEEGAIDLAAPIQKWLSEFQGANKEGVTAQQLAQHCAGLPPYMKLHLESPVPPALPAIFSVPLSRAPGKEVDYSCLGFILLQQVIERVAGPLDAFTQHRIFEPLEMIATMFRPNVQTPPTEIAGDWRRQFEPDIDPDAPLSGYVHDPLAFQLGGVSGNAGLFSSALDVTKFAQFALRSLNGSNAEIVSPPLVRRWSTAEFGSRTLGWDTSQFGDSVCFGHTGYTGNSLWIDSNRKVFSLLLSNRVYPDDTASLIEFRKLLHPAMLAAACGGD